MDSILSCTNLCKSFIYTSVPQLMLQDRLFHWRRYRWPREIVHVLRGVTLAVRRGEWVGIHGPNGSGKTTLLKILAGILPQDRGDVRCAGRLSAFFELGTGFHPERAAAENIYLHGLLHGMDPASVRLQTDVILDFAGLGHVAAMPYKCFSTGMRLRLGFAAAMHVDADCYLLDELAAVGDEAYRRRCREHLLERKHAGVSAVLVSHSLDDLQTLCDRVLLLEEGVLQAERLTYAAEGGIGREERADVLHAVS